MTVKSKEVILEDGTVAQGVVSVNLDGSVNTGGATEAGQQTQTAHLAAIETAVEQIGVTRYVAISNWESKIAFTGVAAAGVAIQNFRVIDLNTSATLSSVWSNLESGLDLASPPIIGTEIEYIGGTAVTLAEMQSLGIATQATLAAIESKINNKGLVLQFSDITVAPVVPATDLAAWNTYFGFTDTFNSVEVNDNFVTLYALGNQYTLNATVFPTADVTGLLSFIDNDGIFIDTNSGCLRSPGLLRWHLPAIEHIDGEMLDSCSVKFFHAHSLKRFSSLAWNNSIPSAVVIDIPECFDVGGAFVGGESNFGPNLEYFNAPKVTELYSDFAFAQPIGGVTTRHINLQSMIRSGASFLAGTIFTYLDISSCVYLASGAFSGTTGIGATVKVHPELLNNAEYIAFKAANSITEIVVYPEGWIKQSTLTDVSGTITTGGVAQSLIATDDAGYRFSIRNHHAIESLWFNELGADAIAGQPSQEVPAKGYYESPVGMTVISAVSIIGAVTGQSFTARKY